MWDDAGDTAAFTQEPVDWKQCPAALAGEIHSREKEKTVRRIRCARLASLGLVVAALLVAFLLAAGDAGTRFPHRAGYEYLREKYEAAYIESMGSNIHRIDPSDRYSIYVDAFIEDDIVTVDEEHLLALEKLYERRDDLDRQQSEILKNAKNTAPPFDLSLLPGLTETERALFESIEKDMERDDVILPGYNLSKLTETERAALESIEAEVRSLLPKIYRQEELIIGMKRAAYRGQCMLGSLPTLIFFAVFAAAGFLFIPLYLNHLCVDFQKKTLKVTNAHCVCKERIYSRHWGNHCEVQFQVEDGPLLDMISVSGALYRQIAPNGHALLVRMEPGWDGYVDRIYTDLRYDNE